MAISSTSTVVNLFKMNKLNLCEEEFLMSRQVITSSPFKNNLITTQSKIQLFDQSTLSLNDNCNLTLPNNRNDPILIESKQYPNVDLINKKQNNSNFSNFVNYKSMLDNQNQQRSKYFDVYIPNNKPLLTNNSMCNSLSSSQSSSASKESDLSKNNSSINSSSTSRFAINDHVKNYNLHANPIQFNMDKVHYVNTLDKAKSIVDLIERRSKVISINCDSDCCLQNGIDLLEIAITFDSSLDHPEIYVFDIHLEPKIIDLFKPIFANSNIVKVMFDARFDLRILCRKYGVTEFTALFDIQLAYRVLLAKLTNSSFYQIKREKLLYVSWQCNGPLVNLEKMNLPSLYYFKNRKFWQARPINFETMYHAAYDVFVMLPQLFTNLMVIMERTLDDEHQQLFIKRSNNLVSSNLVDRKFAFFYTKHQYLNEMHRQMDLLIQSDILYRKQQHIKWQQQQQLTNGECLDEDNNCFDDVNNDLLKNQINDIDTNIYKSYSNISDDLIDSDDLMVNEDLFQSYDSHYSSNSPNQHQLIESINESGTFNEEDRSTIKHCTMCSLFIKSDRLSQLLNNLDQSDSNLNDVLYTSSKYCECIQSQLFTPDDEYKCMNLLVDQIIDLAECKEDYMDLDD